MRSLRTILFALTALVVGLALAGCDNPLKVPDNPSFTPSLTVYGKVKDRFTGAGIGGVKISMKVNGAWKSVTSSTSTSTTLNESAGTASRLVDTALGDFALTGLPTTVFDAPIVVQPAAPYITDYGNVSFPTIGNNNAIGGGGNISYNLGDVFVDRGVTATVVVVDPTNGQYVQPATGQTLRIHRQDLAFRGMDQAIAAPGANANEYTIVLPGFGSQSQGTNTRQDNLLVEPVDSNGDGILDYQSATGSVTDFEKSAQGGTPFVTIQMNRMAPNNNSPTAINALTANTVSEAGLGDFLGTADPLIIFYNQPVALIPELPVTVTVTDNLKAGTTAFTATRLTSPAGITVTPGLLGGTMLTIKTVAALIAQESYTATGGLRGYQVFSGQLPTFDTRTTDINSSFNVNSAGSFTTADVSADNANSCASGSDIAPFVSAAPLCSAGGSAGNVRLLFPERAAGRLIVTGFDTGGGTPNTGNTRAYELTNAPSANPGPCNTVQFYPKQGTGGADVSGNQGYARSGIACRIDLSGSGVGGTAVPAMADQTTGTARTVTVLFDVWDSEGNRIRGSRTIPID